MALLIRVTVVRRQAQGLPLQGGEGVKERVTRKGGGQAQGLPLQVWLSFEVGRRC